MGDLRLVPFAPIPQVEDEHAEHGVAGEYGNGIMAAPYAFMAGLMVFADIGGMHHGRVGGGAPAEALADRDLRVGRRQRRLEIAVHRQPQRALLGQKYRSDKHTSEIQSLM